MSIAQIEEKKRFLKRYGWIRDQMEELKEEITDLCLTTMLPKGISYSGMPHGSGGNRDMSIYAAKLDALIDRRQKKVNEMAECLEEIEAAIEGIEGPDAEKEKLVLRYKYILRKEWRDIAAAMGYKDVRTLYKLRKRALLHLKMPEKPVQFIKISRKKL